MKENFVMFSEGTVSFEETVFMAPRFLLYPKEACSYMMHLSLFLALTELAGLVVQLASPYYTHLIT